MSKTRIRIPQEIVDFFSKSGGRSLVLRGGPGTGKTTFALELLEHMNEQYMTHYISARVEDNSLYDHFPWLKGSKSRYIKRVTNARHLDGEVNQDIQRRKEHMNKIAVDRTELDKLEARVESGEIFDESDASSNFQNGNLTFEILTILPEIDAAYDVLEEALPQNGLIVIDSIEALSEKYGISSRRLIYTLQKDLVENTGSNVAFILEKDNWSNLEFLADGVISFSMSEHQGRRIRTIHLQKLRGIPIENHRMIFTLFNGRFKCFNKQLVLQVQDAYNSPTREIGNEVKISSGYPDIDKLIGGIHKSSINYFELGDGVDTYVLKMFLSNLIVNSLKGNMGTYILLPERIGIKDIEDELKLHHITSEQERSLKFIEIAEMGAADLANNKIFVEGESLSNDLRWDVINQSLSGSTSPYLFITGFDTIKSVYGKDSYLNLIRHISTLKKNDGIFFGYGWSSDEDTKKFSKYANTHVKIECIDGTHVLYGERPNTNIYTLSFSKSPNNNAVELKLNPVM